MFWLCYIFGMSQWSVPFYLPMEILLCPPVLLRYSQKSHDYDNGLIPKKFQTIIVPRWYSLMILVIFFCGAIVMLLLLVVSETHPSSINPRLVLFETYVLIYVCLVSCVPVSRMVWLASPVSRDCGSFQLNYLWACIMKVLINNHHPTKNKRPSTLMERIATLLSAWFRSMTDTQNPLAEEFDGLFEGRTIAPRPH